MPQSTIKAVEFFRKASAQGNTDSAAELERLGKIVGGNLDDAMDRLLPAGDDWGRFSSGERIEVAGLTRKVELNGLKGIVVSFSRDSGRYAVVIDGFAEASINIKPENVRDAPP